MKYTFLLLFVFLGLALNLQAQAPSDSLAKALLWQIKGKGIKKHCYLYGTIHITEAKRFELSPATLKAFKKTKAAYFELDMSKQLAMAAEMVSLAPMRGKKLVELLSEEEYELVKTYFTKETKSQEAKALPFSMYENWQPILLQSFLYTDMLEGPSKSYEMEFLSLASQQKKAIGGLETVSDQIAALGNVPYDVQAQALVKMIRELKQDPTAGRASFIEMMELYQSKNIEAMASMVDSDEQLKEGQDALLKKRNESWIPRIVEQAKKEATFFAVGAAHLGGTNGVIRLLRAQGYEVTPVE